MIFEEQHEQIIITTIGFQKVEFDRPGERSPE